MRDQGTVFVLIAIVVVIAAGFGIYQWWRRKKEADAFIAFATRRGWQYRRHDPSLVKRFRGTPFGRGHSRQAKHVVTGTYRGRQLTAFEYIYKVTRNSGKHQTTQTYRHTVVALPTPAVRPTLQVDREGFGRKLLGVVGVRDLQLESEQFNETFHIDTESDRFAYDILHPRMMEHLLADPRAQSLPFRFERSDLLTWDSSSIDTNSVLVMLDYLCDLLDRVPEFVWKS